eukprot:1919727-Lingulodinium_polyedra.AAC.1
MVPARPRTKHENKSPPDALLAPLTHARFSRSKSPRLGATDLHCLLNVDNTNLRPHPANNA